jgi:SOS-response transcriptional repressor LexA
MKGIEIQFLKGDAPDFSPCTSVQAETYRVIKELLVPGKRVKRSEILERLNLKDPRPYYSRLTHLQEKGYLRWREAPNQATA